METLDTAKHVLQNAAESFAFLRVERHQIRHSLDWCYFNRQRIRRYSRHRGYPSVEFRDHTLGGVVGFPSSRESTVWAIGDVIERIDLSVRMVDGRADIATGILEDQYVVHIVSRSESLGARGPRVDQERQRVGIERGQPCAVVAGIQHHLAATVGHRRPSIGNDLDGVRLGCLDPADTKWTTLGRQIRPMLTRCNDVHHGAEPRIRPDVLRRARKCGHDW